MLTRLCASVRVLACDRCVNPARLRAHLRLHRSRLRTHLHVHACLPPHPACLYKTLCFGGRNNTGASSDQSRIWSFPRRPVKAQIYVHRHTIDHTQKPHMSIDISELRQTAKLAHVKNCKLVILTTSSEALNSDELYNSKTTVCTSRRGTKWAQMTTVFV